MARQPLVNAQITDAVTQTNVKVIGEAPAEAVGVATQALAHAVGLAMENATPDVKAIADRVIGHNNGDAIGRLIDEVLLGGGVVHDAG